MSHWHCTACHHEWDGDDDECDWCGAGGYVLEEETPLEALVRDLFEGFEEDK